MEWVSCGLGIEGGDIGTDDLIEVAVSGFGEGGTRRKVKVVPVADGDTSGVDVVILKDVVYLCFEVGFDFFLVKGSGEPSAEG